MKTRQNHSTSSAKRKKILRGGRPTKSSERKILEMGSMLISREFWFRPLRRPVDVHFAPYYERILKRDLSAISDYVDRNAAQRDLDPSFYELLGRLVTLRFYASADVILSGIERLGNIGYPTKENVHAYWYAELLPVAESAKKWIRGYIKSHPDKWEREQSWRSYAEETSKDDWERENESRAMGLSPFPLVCNLERHRTIYHKGEGPLWGESYVPLWRGHYLQIGLVPKELFWLLAQQRGSAKRPSWAVREYLRRCDANLKARLKSVRKKNH